MTSCPARRGHPAHARRGRSRARIRRRARLPSRPRPDGFRSRSPASSGHRDSARGLPQRTPLARRDGARRMSPAPGRSAGPVVPGRWMRRARWPAGPASGTPCLKCGPSWPCWVEGSETGLRPWLGLRQQHPGEGPCPPGGPLGAEGLGRAVHAFHDQDQVVGDRRRVRVPVRSTGAPARSVA